MLSCARLRVYAVARDGRTRLATSPPTCVGTQSVPCGARHGSGAHPRIVRRRRLFSSRSPSRRNRRRCGRRVRAGVWNSRCTPVQVVPRILSVAQDLRYGDDPLVDVIAERNDDVHDDVLEAPPSVVWKATERSVLRRLQPPHSSGRRPPACQAGRDLTSGVVIRRTEAHLSHASVLVRRDRSQRPLSASPACARGGCGRVSVRRFDKPRSRCCRSSGSRSATRDVRDERSSHRRSPSACRRSAP